MSVSLTCGSCGAVIGNASHEDNYIEHYLKTNKHGEPMCPNCGNGGNDFWLPFKVVGFFIILALLVGGCCQLIWGN